MYLDKADIMKIVGCSAVTANKIKRKVLDYSASKGVISVGNNKCLTRDFCKLYGLSPEEIKRALSNQE